MSKAIDDAITKGADIVVLCLKGAVWVGVCFPLLGAAYLTCAHAVAWLKLGKWPHYSTANMFSDWGLIYPKVTWRGAQSIIDLLMSAPATWALFGLAILVGFIFADFIGD